MSRPFRLVLLLVPALGLLACGPLGPFSGGRLRGEVAAMPAPWPDLSGVENAQLETNPDDPHSINIWCADVDGAVFVSTSLILGPEEPTERTWVKNVSKDPDVRLRVDGTVYEARLTKLEDAALREQVLARFEAKYGELSPERTPGAWIYRVAPR